MKISKSLDQLKEQGQKQFEDLVNAMESELDRALADIVLTRKKKTKTSLLQLDAEGFIGDIQRDLGRGMLCCLSHKKINNELIKRYNRKGIILSVTKGYHQPKIKGQTNDRKVYCFNIK